MLRQAQKTACQDFIMIGQRPDNFVSGYYYVRTRPESDASTYYYYVRKPLLGKCADQKMILSEQIEHVSMYLLEDIDRKRKLTKNSFDDSHSFPGAGCFMCAALWVF